MFSVSTPHMNRTLAVGETIPVTVTFRHSQRGRFEGRLEITFTDIASGRTFVVVRRLCAIVGNAQDHELLKPAAPYVKNKRVQWRTPKAGGGFVEGERPPGIDDVPWVRKLPKARIPKNLEELLRKGSTSEAIDGIKKSGLFPEPMVNLDSHSRRFSCMLWIEEARMV